jgi:hypothetical protein
VNKQDEELVARIGDAFHFEFQPVQQELAALVTAVRSQALAFQQIGMAVAKIEAILTKIRDAADDIAESRRPKPRSSRSAKVIPFIKRKRRKPPGPGVA